jgi:hypothetical protein
VHSGDFEGVRGWMRKVVVVLVGARGGRRLRMLLGTGPDCLMCEALHKEDASGISETNP